MELNTDHVKTTQKVEDKYVLCTLKLKVTLSQSSLMMRCLG